MTTIYGLRRPLRTGAAPEDPIPNDELIVLAGELLETFRSRAGDQLELIAGSSEFIRDADISGPAD